MSYSVLYQYSNTMSYYIIYIKKMIILLWYDIIDIKICHDINVIDISINTTNN